MENIIFGLIAGFSALYVFNLSNQLKQVKKQMDRTNQWCATFELVMKESAVWVYDKEKNAYTANLYLANNKKIELHYKEDSV